MFVSKLAMTSVTSVIGKTTMSIDADDIIWRFFQAHPLPTTAPDG